MALMNRDWIFIAVPGDPSSGMSGGLRYHDRMKTVGDVTGSTLRRHPPQYRRACISGPTSLPPPLPWPCPRQIPGEGASDHPRPLWTTAYDGIPSHPVRTLVRRRRFPFDDNDIFAASCLCIRVFYLHVKCRMLPEMHTGLRCHKLMVVDATLNVWHEMIFES